MKQKCISFSLRSLGRQSRTVLVAVGTGTRGFYCFVVLPLSACDFHLLSHVDASATSITSLFQLVERQKRDPGKDISPSLSRHGPGIAYITSMFCCSELGQRVTPTDEGGRGMWSSAGISYAQLKLVLLIVKGENRGWGRRISFCCT